MWGCNCSAGEALLLWQIPSGMGLPDMLRGGSVQFKQGKQQQKTIGPVGCHGSLHRKTNDLLNQLSYCCMPCMDWRSQYLYIWCSGVVITFESAVQFRVTYSQQSNKPAEKGKIEFIFILQIAIIGYKKCPNLSMEQLEWRLLNLKKQVTQSGAKNLVIIYLLDICSSSKAIFLNVLPNFSLYRSCPQCGQCLHTVLPSPYY